MINFESILTITITLFAIIDMLGNIPLILKLRKESGEIESLKSSIVAVLIMIFTLYTGKYLFSFLGIDINHFALAGSFLLVWFGIKMVLGIEDKPSDNKSKMNASVFPLAFPLISGPGTLATVMSFRAEFNDIDIILGILLNGIVIFTILKSARWIAKKLGESGVMILERIFGIILIAIGMKMLITNLIISIQQVSESINC